MGREWRHCGDNMRADPFEGEAGIETGYDRVFS